MKVKILDDDTIWDVEHLDESKGIVIVKPTPEYLEYHRLVYDGGNEFPEPIDNEYDLEDVEILQP